MALLVLDCPPSLRERAGALKVGGALKVTGRISSAHLGLDWVLELTVVEPKF